MDLTKNFEVMNFPFSDVLPGKVSTSKIFSFSDSNFKKYKDQKIVNFLLSNIIPRVVSTCRILHIATAWQIPIKF